MIHVLLRKRTTNEGASRHWNLLRRRGGRIMYNWSKGRDRSQPRTPHTCHTHVPRTQRRGQKLSDQINAEHKTPGGGRSDRKTNTNAKKSNARDKRIDPSLPIAFSSPRHLFVVLLESDPDPGKEAHHANTKRGGWVFDAK